RATQPKATVARARSPSRDVRRRGLATGSAGPAPPDARDVDAAASVAAVTENCSNRSSLAAHAAVVGGTPPIPPGLVEVQTRSSHTVRPAALTTRQEWASPNVATTSSDRAGQASAAQGPKSRLVTQAQASPAPGSTHRNVPDRPKWPKVRGELRRPVQCGVFPSRSSKPRPQSLGRWRPKPGRTPSRPGKAT